MEIFWSIVAIVGGLVMVGVIIYSMLTGFEERHAEEAARAYYDEHGHWPDEAPQP